MSWVILPPWNSELWWNYNLRNLCQSAEFMSIPDIVQTLSLKGVDCTMWNLGCWQVCWVLDTVTVLHIHAYFATSASHVSWSLFLVCRHRYYDAIEEGKVICLVPSRTPLRIDWRVFDHLRFCYPSCQCISWILPPFVVDTENSCRCLSFRWSAFWSSCLWVRHFRIWFLFWCNF